MLSVRREYESSREDSDFVRETNLFNSEALQLAWYWNEERILHDGPIGKVAQRRGLLNIYIYDRVLIERDG